MNKVEAWKAKTVIPTYEVGTPEKYPVFLDKRVYQASSGIVYPHPVTEKISDEKIDKEWDLVYLENKYIKVMIIPALGGRIQMAYDKIRERHFVYYNSVIKPALVGLTGPWISGGIEFNWPQHHRPSTYDPTDFYIEENADGSKTVWVSELERMFRTKGMAGFTLHPDKAYIEIKAQLYNRTPHPQTFLWWANPAVAVNEHYQSVFPPDVNAVFDHGKRDVSEFPIAKGEYYKVNYAPGTDISRYKNIPVPTSYMAIQSEYDFVGGYENDSKGGLLHVADHHVSPGKKQWTWGNGDFGKAWDRNLTDSDGPYIELMCGVYTDNQPDFSWMHPYEEKSFRQYFMPYYNVGVVKNATKEALLNLEVEHHTITLKLHVTANYPQCRVVLSSENTVIFDEIENLSPENGFEKSFTLPEYQNEPLKAGLYEANGNCLVSWSYPQPVSDLIPEPAKAAKAPENIDADEQLFLNGLHIEQYRHATYDPTDYYLEALSRNPTDVRCNNAMGLWYLRKSKFETALPYFETAITTLTSRNPNPYDGEPYFNKGLTLKFMGKKEEAYSAFFKACWNAAWQDAGYFNLAQIDTERKNFDKALDLIDRALIKNWHNHKARHLKVVILRKKYQQTKALALIEDSLAIDRFNFGVLYEKYLITQEASVLAEFKEIIRDNPHNYIEFSLDYAHAGLFEEAISLLEIHRKDKTEVYPMICYFQAWYNQQLGNIVEAQRLYVLAQQMPQTYCFPNRIEETIVLEAAIKHNPLDANALYYLGNYWYAAKQYADAQTCWETSIQIDSTNAVCHRNLALLYFNKTEQKTLAQEHLEKAFALDNQDARLLMELDQFYKKINLPVEQRLAFLESNLSLVVKRDDLYLEYVTLHNFTGNHSKALALLAQRIFHPWEGGEGKVPFQYITANVEQAKIYIQANQLEKAIEHLEAAKVYPHNLGEGKLYGTQENDINYWLGCVYELLGEESKALQYWKEASIGLAVPSPALFYNDQQPDKIFYQGLALLKLGQKEEAFLRFSNLVAYGNEHINDDVKLDYFAISLPDLLIWEENLNKRNQIHCHYLIGLGKMGLNELSEANQALSHVITVDTYHIAARIHLKLLLDYATQLENA